MRTRVLVASFEMQFDGSAQYWNECLRPIFGGPAAKEAAVVDSEPSLDGRGTKSDEPGTPDLHSDEAPVAAPREKRSSARAPRKPVVPAPGSPATDAELLYADLAMADGRRAEKDAVLATVWLLGGTLHDVTFGAVAIQLHSFEAFRDVRVKPLLLKHCSRSRMLEPGAERETVRMTKKGNRYIAGLMG